jgi:hypothetical protein
MVLRIILPDRKKNAFQYRVATFLKNPECTVHGIWSLMLAKSWMI